MGLFRFNDTAWLEHPAAIPLSLSLPLASREYIGQECHAFFGGILPEYEKRELIAKILGVSARLCAPNVILADFESFGLQIRVISLKQDHYSCRNSPNFRSKILQNHSKTIRRTQPRNDFSMLEKIGESVLVL